MGLFCQVVFGEVPPRYDKNNRNGNNWGGVKLFTDGVWVWDNLLLILVRKFNFQLDDAFVQHMKENQWEVPEFDLADPEILKSLCQY